MNTNFEDAKFIKHHKIKKIYLFLYYINFTEKKLGKKVCGAWLPLHTLIGSRIQLFLYLSYFYISICFLKMYSIKS